MIAKYSLTFNDPKLENLFQTYMTTRIHLPLFRNIIIVSSLIIIVGIIEKILELGTDLLHRNRTLIKYGFCLFIEVIFFIIYKYKHKYIRYALLFYNHLLVVLYALMDNFSEQQKLLYAIGIIIFITVNMLFEEFWEALYQTVVFGLTFLILAFSIDHKIDYTIITMIITAMILLIFAFYINIKALRSQFQLGKIENQWEQIFKSTVKDQDYIVFQYEDKDYSFHLSHQCPAENINNTEQLRNLLRKVQVTKKMNLEQELFNSITNNVDRQDIVNEEVYIPLINGKQRSIVYSVFFGFNTIILLQFKSYMFVEKNREQAIEKSYQLKYKKLLKLMIQVVKKFSLNKNVLQMICKLRKFCLYAHLKDIMLKDGKFLFTEQLMSYIDVNNIIQCLQSLYFHKEITLENLIDQDFIGCKQLLLITLIEIVEISLSKYIELEFGLENNIVTIQVYFNYYKKSSIQLSKSLHAYQPLFIEVQFEKQYIVVKFQSFVSYSHFQQFVEQNNNQLKLQL